MEKREVNSSSFETPYNQELFSGEYQLPGKLLCTFHSKLVRNDLIFLVFLVLKILKDNERLVFLMMELQFLKYIQFNQCYILFSWFGLRIGRRHWRRYESME